MTRHTRVATALAAAALILTLGACSMNSPEESTTVPLDTYTTEATELMDTLLATVPDEDTINTITLSSRATHADADANGTAKKGDRRYWDETRNVELSPDAGESTLDHQKDLAEKLTADGWVEDPGAAKLNRDNRNVVGFNRDDWYVQISAATAAPPKAQNLEIWITSPTTTG